MLDCQLDNARHAADTAKPATTTGTPNTKPKRERVKLMGIRQHLEVQRVRQQEKQEPDHWFVRKFIIGIVVGVFGYSYYVYVVRLCVPMIRMQDNRLGGRAQGLVYLVIYHLLFVMFVWTYLVAVATPPGFARDYVPETDPPQAEEEYITVAGQAFEDQLQPIRPSKLAPADLYKSTSNGGHRSTLRRSSSSLRSASLSTPEEEDEEATAGTEQTVEMRQTGNGRVVVPLAAARTNEEDAIAETAPTVGVLGPTLGTVLASTNAAVPSPSEQEEGLQMPEEDRSPRCRSTGSTTLAPSDEAAAAAPTPVTRPDAAHVPERLPGSTSPSSDSHIADVPPPPRRSASPAARSRQSYLDFPDPPPELEPPKPLAVERIPRSLPILTEQYRYDPRERIVRPYRSHRCKHCAKVVLKMDHHCPWVGSCVGAQNYKYFYNFLQWSSAYLFFVFLTLLIAQTLPLGTFPATRPYPGVDGQQIAIIALSFFFLFFTGSLLVQHTGLILRNMTTIEQIGLARMRQRERAALASEYGFFGYRAKKATRREWDKRWGRPDREGNIWWLGSSRANWEMVFGKAKLGWFLPIPSKPTMDDGLHYVPNPRFSPEGYWRERRFWPADLR
ncbi:hypothetical protein JCM8115_000692 [Rhodotorula mucilaginosa]